MKCQVLEPFRTRNGKTFRAGDEIEGAAETLLPLIEKGRVRPVLSVGSWVRSDDRIGQVVSYAEGEAVVRIFNDYGGFHDMRMAVSGLIPTEAPERPPMPVPGYMAGDRVRYSYKEAMNVREGTIVETRIFPAGCWYRIKDGDTLRWISEGHIQKERAQ
ncbi:hypothetical protein ABH19_11435 [Leptospirillum sp. Group II 'CF-1']|uniref:hypothetical protein n=1 Tax=Leptospirillum sp. Group II 'CF-1' TaxID=1660083 RepID=UPI0000F0C7E4|nr:hypothetical protein [Leptospirillum sp. Group II 'CF-1']AKS24223.1 hypothetical protein ABH19_11435 [Leptospirillum sp. Group II 'CF-1']EAY56567.1 MAG: hypothetical protein UBAL2_80620214 [Leptospirillum rubarum]